MIERGVVFDLAAGAALELADGVALGAGCRFHLGPGARVVVGAGTRLGDRCAVTALRSVTIGARCLLADEVVLIDAEPRFADAERPIREQGLDAAAIVVGDGARIGPSAAIGAGATLAPGATVGANATVS